MGLVVSAKFQNEKCFYLPALFLDNDSAIAAGREIYGSPKKLVKIILEERNEIFVASCIRNEIEIFRITTKILCPAEESDFPEICPVYNLKMIPSIDKPGADIKQITSTGRNNVKTHWMFKCAGSINFSPTTATNIWKLKPKEIIGASRFMMDYEQGYGRVIFDYPAKLHK